MMKKCFIPNMYMNSNDKLTLNTLNSMNMGNNFRRMMQSNMYQNNPMKNNLNNFEGMNFRNNNCKSIRLYYAGEFIQNINIDKDESISSINEKFKNILYSLGKVYYRNAREDDIIERTSPDETLEFLIKRGVIDNHPSLEIHQRRCFRVYPYTTYYFDDLEDGEILEVEYRGKVYGAGCLSMLEFVDVDDLTKTKKLKFSSKAPKWRKVSIGLNLFGKCLNKKCEAFNAEVIHRVGINKEFDFNSDKREIKCPICAKNFLPSTMGFWKCEYQIKGEKFKDGDYEEVELNGKETNGNDFEYYDPYKSGATFWSSLKVFTGHRQKMKFRKFII